MWFGQRNGCHRGENGQSLVEVLIAVAVGTIMIAAAVTALVPALVINTQVNELQVAAALGKELLDNMRVLSESDWNQLYGVSSKGVDAHYYISTSTPFVIAAGEETVRVGTSTYLRYFYLENVCRETAGPSVSAIAGVQDAGGTCPGVSVEDPSTQRTTVVYRAVGKPERTLSTYLVRYRDRVLVQTDWFGGPGESGPRATSTSRFFTSLNILYASTTGSIFLGPASADPTQDALGSPISTSTNEHWAWNDLVGWMQWRDWPVPDTLGIRVRSDKLTRFASSSDGEVSLDCETSPLGNICGRSNYFVTNDGSGFLAGWAWNDAYGWTSFNCTNHSGCAVSNYQVRIDSDGFFRGYAWNDVVGWISFNCADYSYCAISDYKVRTTWRPIAASGTLESATFDTNMAGVSFDLFVAGASFNSFVWHGDKPGDSRIEFQIAVSNFPAGPWSFTGASGDALTYYGETSLPGASVPLRYDVPRGRYFRYRVRLWATTTEPRESPRVDDVIINWSP